MLAAFLRRAMTDSTEGTDEQRFASEVSTEWLPAKGRHHFDVLHKFLNKRPI